MNNQKSDDGSDKTLRPQVIVIETPHESSVRVAEQSAPRVIATGQTGRVISAPPSEPQPVTDIPSRLRRYSLTIRVGLAGLIAAFCGWIGVDLYLWIASAFNFGTGLGWAATAAAATGITAAVAMLAHEMKGYLALKNVEANQQRFAVPWETMKPSYMQEIIRGVIVEIPRDRESKAAIGAFQRKVQHHHSPAQQIELFSQTVMTPLDRRAEAIVRRAGARAFGITAISPAAITDVLFFVACSVRMVREIATCYGHRPTALATAHLLRRLVVEAGTLGAVDFAAATLTQHIGGAVAERVATGAAESIYAAQRMARLGLVTMGLCRPIPFRRNELPGILSSLIGNLFARPAEIRQDVQDAS
jgi:putative membrane protein